MHLHKAGYFTRWYAEQYASDGNKKNAFGGKMLPRRSGRQKKNATSGRAIAPPRRVSLAVNKNGFKRMLFSCPPRMVEL